MDNIYPNEGLTEVWSRFIAQEQLRLHLFVNNFTPDHATVLADLTEASWTGYAEETIDAADIVTNALLGDIAIMTLRAYSFANSSGGDVDSWGYYITDDGNTKLIQAVRFDAMRTTPDGDTVDVIPTFTAFSEL